MRLHDHALRLRALMSLALSEEDDERSARWVAALAHETARAYPLPKESVSDGQTTDGPRGR